MIANCVIAEAICASYFNAPAAIGGSNPNVWHIATLLVATGCAFGAVRAIRHRRNIALITLACLAPVFFGLAATVIQIHLIFSALTTDYIGTAAPFEASIYHALYSAHIGGFGSLLLFVLAAVRWRTVARNSSISTSTAPS